MDPLSIAASVVGTASAATTVRKTLSEFIASTRSSPEEVRRIEHEVTVIIAISNALVLWLQEQNNVPNRELLENLDQTLRATTLLMSHLSKMLRKMQPGSGRSAQLRARMAWSLQKEEMMELLSSLESHKAALSLFLQVAQLTNTQQMRERWDQTRTGPDPYGYLL